MSKEFIKPPHYRGSKEISESERMRLVSECRSSKLSVAAFCRHHGILDNAMYRWLKEYVDTSSVSTASTNKDSDFITFVAPDSLSGVEYKLTVRSGLTITVPSGFDSTELLSLVRVLREA